jgi:anaerobic dimethyl sulfoxide reductase subunit C (anchor subunit)
MNTREWALLIFSILTQLAVGMMLVLLIVRTYAVRKLGEEKASELTAMPFYVVVPVMVLAMVASLFHLGKLLNIIGAVPNLATSWMSREVVFAVTFMILTAVFAFLQGRKFGTTNVLITIGWIAAAVGLVLIYCMGMTYMLPAQPAWNSLATPINFYLASLLLGVLGTAAALMAGYARIQKKNAEMDDFVKSTLQMIAIAGIVLLGLEFLVLPLYLAFLSTQGTAAIHSLGLMFNVYGVLLAFRLIFVFAGAGVLAAYLYRKAAAGGEKTLATLTYSAFALVLLGEVLARFLFYATHFKIGI